MGALIAKPSQADHRVWDLKPHQTINYFEFVSDPRLTIYTFARRAVRVLSVFNWISDRTRYSYDGWYKQRLIDCFLSGMKTDWYGGLGILSETVLDRDVTFHWSSLEEEAFYSVYSFLESVASKVYLPYTRLRPAELMRSLSNPKQTRLTFGWSPREIAPTLDNLILNSFVIGHNTQNCTLVKDVLDILSGRGYIGLTNNCRSLSFFGVPTSVDETERSWFSGGTWHGSSLTIDTSAVLLQTEAVTTSLFRSSLYMGSHGFINASLLEGALPILLPYERYSEVTGRPFLKGPINSRTHSEVVMMAAQYYSLAVGNWAYRRKKSFRYRLKKGTNYSYVEKFRLHDKKLSFSEDIVLKSVFFGHLGPEFAVSDLQQCIFNRYMI